MPETKSKKTWIYVGVAVLVVVGFFAGTSYFKKEKSGVDFIVVEKSNLVQEVSVTGSIKPADEVELGFEISGKVSSVKVDVGDKVYAGQTAVKLYSGDLQAKLLRAKANLAVEKANLAKLEAGTRIEEINIQKVKVENARTALLDAKKDVLNKLRDAYSKSDDAVRSKVDQLFSNPRSTNPKLDIIISNNQLETDIESGRLEVEQMLVSWGNDLGTLSLGSDLLSFVSTTDDNLSEIRNFLDNVALAVNSLTESADMSQTVIDGYKTDIWTARTNENIATTNITASQEKLRTALSSLALAQNELALKEAPATNEDIAAQQARVLSADASVKDALAGLAKTIIRSPISGVVTNVDIKVGEIISPNTSLVSVISDNDFEIDANIAESDIAKISLGDSANVTLDAYGDGVVFNAIVTKIDPAETVIEGVPTYKTTFSLLPDGKSVKSGMTANIDILTDKRTDIIAVPARAVKVSDGEKIVKVIDNSEVITERKVETGLRGSDGRIEILSGVKEGEKVITFMP
jgi:HlyD family secretion protein